jgi:uncharacterized membrane protein YfcA
MIGIAKTGAPGVGSLMVPLMVLTTGDARQAAGWTLPILSTADIYAVIYWRRHADAKKLFSMIPWTLAVMVAGALALSLREPVMRRRVALILLLMLAIQIRRRWGTVPSTEGKSGFYGVLPDWLCNYSCQRGRPVMNLYLLSQRLPREQFVATGAWFFFVVNLTKAPIYAWYHLFSRPSLAFNLMMVPLVLAAAFTGSWIVRRISQELFVSLVLVLTGLCALALFF